MHVNPPIPGHHSVNNVDPSPDNTLLNNSIGGIGKLPSSWVKIVALAETSRTKILESVSAAISTEKSCEEARCAIVEPLRIPRLASEMFCVRPH